MGRADDMLVLSTDKHNLEEIEGDHTLSRTATAKHAEVANALQIHAPP